MTCGGVKWNKIKHNHARTIVLALALTTHEWQFQQQRKKLQCDTIDYKYNMAVNKFKKKMRFMFFFHSFTEDSTQGIDIVAVRLIFFLGNNFSVLWERNAERQKLFEIFFKKTFEIKFWENSISIRRGFGGFFSPYY